MSERIDAVVTTKNTKGLSFQSPKLDEDFEMPKDSNIAAAVLVEVPTSLEEAAGEEFYGSEEAALKALKQDWSRRCVNAARPILREAESDLDWDTVAQQAVDGYKPGRRGGFAPKVTEDELEDFEDVDALREFLRKRGVVKA